MNRLSYPLDQNIKNYIYPVLYYTLVHNNFITHTTNYYQYINRVGCIPNIYL